MTQRHEGPPDTGLEASADGYPPLVGIEQLYEHAQRVVPALRGKPLTLRVIGPGGFSPLTVQSSPRIHTTTYYLDGYKADGRMECITVTPLGDLRYVAGECTGEHDGIDPATSIFTVRITKPHVDWLTGNGGKVVPLPSWADTSVLEARLAGMEQGIFPVPFADTPIE